MDYTKLHRTYMNIRFADKFPNKGDQITIVPRDKSEYVIEVYELSNIEWLVENGQTTGVTAEVLFFVVEEQRPSSLGKLRIVE